MSDPDIDDKTLVVPVAEYRAHIQAQVELMEENARLRSEVQRLNTAWEADNEYNRVNYRYPLNAITAERDRYRAALEFVVAVDDDDKQFRRSGSEKLAGYERACEEARKALKGES